ncbi:hypothetical protein [Alcanivorax sp.]|uniref:hypothetical protein n=1 Tax=Alcanivorax sp. TaxID=1872427 RepID=UPI0025C20720|nr:hypothetical protein [Alcanivorax sp.]
MSETASSVLCFGQYLVGEHTRARSLHFLKAIDKTIETLSIMKSRMLNDAREATLFLDEINTIESDFIIESVDETSENLEKYLDNNKKLLRTLKRKRRCADEDSNLLDHDGVIEAYDEVIEACIHVTNTIEDLRWALLEHNADAEQHVVKEENLISSPAEIDAALGKLMND